MADGGCSRSSNLSSIRNFLRIFHLRPHVGASNPPPFVIAVSFVWGFCPTFLGCEIFIGCGWLWVDIPSHGMCCWEKTIGRFCKICGRPQEMEGLHPTSTTHVAWLWKSPKQCSCLYSSGTVLYTYLPYLNARKLYLWRYDSIPSSRLPSTHFFECPIIILTYRLYPNIQTAKLFRSKTTWTRVVSVLVLGTRTVHVRNSIFLYTNKTLPRKSHCTIAVQYLYSFYLRNVHFFIISFIFKNQDLIIFKMRNEYACCSKLFRIVQYIYSTFYIIILLYFSIFIQTHMHST